MAGNEIDLCRGAKEISATVGINWKEITYYVREKKLPAFKIDGKGGWMAVTGDLREWVLKMRDENLKK